MELHNLINVEFNLPSIDEKYPKMNSIMADYKKNMKIDVSLLEDQKVLESSDSKTKRSSPDPILRKRQLLKPYIIKKANINKIQNDLAQSVNLPIISPFKNKGIHKIAPSNSYSRKNNNIPPSFYLTEVDGNELQSNNNSFVNEEDNNIVENERNYLQTEDNRINRHKFSQYNKHLERKLDDIKYSLRGNSQDIINNSQNFSNHYNHMIDKCHRYLTRIDAKMNIQSDEFLTIPYKKRRYNFNNALDKMVTNIRTINPITAELLLKLLDERNDKNHLRQLAFNNQRKKHDRVINLLEDGRIRTNKILQKIEKNY